MPRSFRTLLAAAAAATAAHCLLGVRLDGLALSVAARRLGGARVNGDPRRILEETEVVEQAQHDDVTFGGQVTDNVLASSTEMSEPLTMESEPLQNDAYITDAAMRATEAVGADDTEEEEIVDGLLHAEASDKQVEKQATVQGVTPNDAAPHREAQEQTDTVEKPSSQNADTLPIQATALNSATAAVATGKRRTGRISRRERRGPQRTGGRGVRSDRVSSCVRCVDGVAGSQLADSEGASQRLLAEANLLSAFQPLTTEEHEEDSTNKAWVGKPVLFRPVLDAAEVARRLGVNEGVARDLVRAVRQLFPIPLPSLPGAELHHQTAESAPKLRSVNSETASADAAVAGAQGKQRRLQVKYTPEDVDELFELENIRLVGERLIDLIKPLFVFPRGVGGYLIGDHNGDAYTATGGATLWTKPLFEGNIFKPSSSTTAPTESSSTTANPNSSSTSTSAAGSSTSSTTAATAGSSSSTTATPGSSSSTPATGGPSPTTATP